MAVLKRRHPHEEKILDVDAAMQGTMVFKDPVNLRINGRFEGKLDTKGMLNIGQHAEVAADIIGEDVTVAGKVTGNITATIRLHLIAPAEITGDIKTPLLSVSEGAVINGRCQMSGGHESSSGIRSKIMLLNEVARYLEVEPSLVEEWANQNKLPGFKEGNTWKFNKEEVDGWIAREKVNR